MSTLQFWRKTNASRALKERIANLTDASGSPLRLNGDLFLNESTHVDDSIVDDAFGDSRRN